jgi:hypothetical protein
MPAGAAMDKKNVVSAAVHQVSSPWFRWFLAQDPAPALTAVRCPVLALNGDRDLQVVAAQNLAGIDKALRAGGNKNVTVKSLPGLNHMFQSCTTCSAAEYGMLEETFSPAAMELVSGWIRKRTGLVEKR